MHDFVLAYKVGFYPHNEKPPGTPVDFYCILPPLCAVELKVLLYNFAFSEG